GDGGGIHSGEMAGYKLVNVTVTGNRAENKGGGICNLQSSSPLDLLNTIVWGNRSDRGNHNISNENKAVPSFENCLVEGCRNSGKWDAAFGKDNGNNTDADPVFADAGKEDFHLEEGSPAIDGGDSVLYMASYSGMFDPGISGLDGQTDLDGHRRRLAANVDIGACEGDGSDGDGDGGDDDGDGEDDGETPVIVPDDRGIVFVNQAKAGNGSSWEEACPNLHDPLLAAQTDPNIRQIWVALGTYTPRRPATGMSVIDSLNRENAFVLVKDVAVYGSFPADANSSEHTGIDDRHLTPHTVGGGSPLTVLSGDLKGDDLPGDLAAGRDDNAYHVVIAAGETGGALLDGFAVTGGNADGNTSVTVNGQEVDRHSGGGIYHDRGGRDTLRLLHLTVTENSAGNGGGIFTRQSCSMISHVSFHGNSAGNGGGMYNGTGAKPVLRHVAVKGNEAGSGGGIFSGEQAKPVLVHVTVNGNMAINGGGMYNAGTDAKPVLTNVTLGGNAAESGGGIYNADGAAPDLCNTIVWGNGNSENIYSDDQCRPLYEYCLIEGCGGSGNSNIDTDPLFAAPVACEGQPVTEGDYRLLEGSPAINRGNIEAFIRVYNEGHESDIADLEGQTDLDGNPCLTGAGLDMGAFEYASGDEPEDPEEPEEPEEVWIVTLPDIAGGAVPGIRSFSVVTPEEEYQILSDTKFQVPDQGNFAFTLAYEYGPVPTVVTANQVTVHPGNGVYTLSAITADQHVTVTASPEVTPPGHKREVVLPRVDGLTTDPPAGVHYVESGKDFVFKIIPVSMAPGFEPRVTTDRTTLPEDGEDVEMIRNEDGTYTVRILRVQEPVTVSIQLVASNEPPLNSTGRQVWSNGARLYICSSQAGSAKIFTLVGQFVKTVDCVAGETGSVALPSGMYMVLLEGKTYKVVIH
ncbi:MAG: DUF5123 domain-containing protein, partial [Tannerella sp.]|nr:DUF5123 domain-containing protein [Tannerella sp.]